MKPSAVLVLLVSLGRPAGAGSEPTSSVHQSPETVRLLEAGRGQRRILRVPPTPGRPEVFVLQARTQMKMMKAGTVVPATSGPMIRLKMQSQVLRGSGKSANPVIEVRIIEAGLVDAGTGASATKSQLEPKVKSLAGAVFTETDTGKGTLINRREQRGASVDPLRSQLLDGIQQSLSQLRVAFPSEPIGIGARWEVTRSVVISGVATTQVASCTLADLTREGGHVRMKLKLSAPQQQVRAPGVSGVELELDSLAGAGDGEVHFDAGSLLPRSARMSVTSEGAFKVQGESLMVRATSEAHGQKE